MLTTWPEPRAHRGQDRLGHSDEPKHVRLKLGAVAGFVAFLEGGEIAVARIVDEHVDSARFLGRGRHSFDVFGRRDIELQRSRVAMAADEIGKLLRIAGGREHTLAA
jgi:hypothetical protein